jgi:carboxyl-terminal processing protease
MVRISHAVVAGLIVAAFVAVLSFVGGWTTSRTVGNIPLRTFVTATLQEQPADTTDTSFAVGDSFDVFWDVWGIVNREFYHTEPLDQQQMVYGAIRGMLGALDDEYTVFQEPEDAERSHESMQGRFEGIGIYMQLAEGEVLVERPIKGSPASNAGLQRGDVIVRVDGEEVADIAIGLTDGEIISEVAERIRGPKGSSVTLSIRRPPATDTFDVAIIRDEVPLISVYAEMLDNQIAYIQITEFKATTTGELDEALRELLPQQPAGIVLDLRNNPGGYLNTAQEVLGRFYEGTALYEQMSDGTTKELHTRGAPDEVRAFEVPIVVLINSYSASASEIVAGALRDMRPNTLLLGETSFGKGSVQNIHRLRDGSSVRITIAQWFTPNQDKIHRLGITPEHIVPFSQEPQYAVPCTEQATPPEGQTTCSDAQFSWALRLLNTGETPPPQPTPTPAPADNQ